MFTFSREFLETFDRRYQDLTEEGGRDFIFAARDWLQWIRADPRTRMAVQDLLKESDDAKARLRETVQEYLPKFVKQRKLLESLKVCDDSAPARIPGPNHPAGIAHHGQEESTFHEFDKLKDNLEFRLLRFEPITDPIEPLYKILQSKVSNYIDGRVELPGGGSRAPKNEERAKRVETLSGLKLNEIRNEYRRKIEAEGMRFFASSGRALRLLDEILDRQMNLISSIASSSWFFYRSNSPNEPSTSQHDFVRAVLTTLAPHEGETEEKEREKALQEWSELIRELLRKCYSALRERLRERASLVTVIDRFRLRSELFDVERFREVAKKRRKNGIRKTELRITQELARYLFDAGYDTFMEVQRGQGRADLVQNGDVYVEAKQISRDRDGRARIIKGYHQAMDGVRQFEGVKAVVLAVYVLDGPRYSLPEFVPAQNDAPETHFIVIDLRPASRRGAEKPQSSVALCVKDFVGSQAVPAEEK